MTQKKVEKETKKERESEREYVCLCVPQQQKRFQLQKKPQNSSKRGLSTTESNERPQLIVYFGKSHDL